MRSGPTSCWPSSFCGISETFCQTSPGDRRCAGPSSSVRWYGRKPKGTGILCSRWGGMARRRSVRAGTSLATKSDNLGAIIPTAETDLRTAPIRRRSQRTALGRQISGPRTASAASSMLLADAAIPTTRAIVDSESGSRAARKSGSKLNVMRPCGQ